MTELWTNNGTSVLAAGITSLDTTLTVGDGSRFPTPDPLNGDYFWATIQQSGVIEIVKCTARAGNIVTVERGQQGTAAAAFIVGALFELRLTAATLAAISESESVVHAASTEAHGSDGDVVGAATLIAAVAAGVASAAAAAGVADVAATTFTAAGVGAVPRSFASKLADTVSVKDFGAVGDGVADDTAAIQNAVDSGATNVYLPKGTYKVTATINLAVKVGLHVHGDSGGSNGLGSSKIYWAGAANGVVMQLFSCSNCTVERIAIQGILGGTPSNPGIGLNVTGLNANGSCNWNVFRDMSIAAIGGSPGDGILVGSATDDDVSNNIFENVLIVGGVNGLVQHGTQTVNNVYRNLKFLDYTDKGMVFLAGDVRLGQCSFFGLPASATIDCVVGAACLWVEIRDSYHEIFGARPVGTQAYGFTSGARAWETTLDGCRILWDIASGYVIKYEQNGALSYRGLTVDAGVGGVGNFLLANGAVTPQPLVRTGNHIAATIVPLITGAWDFEIPPALTEAQRDAITWAEGRQVYNLTTHKLNLRVAAGWEVVTSA